MLLTSKHEVAFIKRNFPKQGYRYYERRKAFSKSYRLLYDLVSKFNVGL